MAARGSMGLLEMTRTCGRVPTRARNAVDDSKLVLEGERVEYVKRDAVYDGELATQVVDEST